jgi:predicted dehydrogenase
MNHSPAIRFGILGCGGISEHFAKALQATPGCILQAVAAREAAKAAAFAHAFHCGTFYGSYEELAADDDVDIIYIATLTSLHAAHAVLCMEHGKNVLCEKPLAVCGEQARRMADNAREQGVFLMEAMWTRFLPATRKAIALLREGAIGTPRYARIDLGVTAPWEGIDARYKHAEGCGGTLIEAGVYAVAMAFGLMGEVQEAVSLADLGASGVDEQNAAVFRHDEGRLTTLFSSLRLSTGNEVVVFGTEGSLTLPAFQGADTVLLRRNGEDARTYSFPMAAGGGFVYEIEEAISCLRRGDKESSLLPVSESVRITEINQRMRNSWGLYFPSDSLS